MFFSNIKKLLGLKDAKSLIEGLEKKIEETHQIALHNQFIILEITKIITDLANDQVILSEHIKKSAGVSDTKKTTTVFSIYSDDDDDFLN